MKIKLLVIALGITIATLIILSLAGIVKGAEKVISIDDEPNTTVTQKVKIFDATGAYSRINDLDRIITEAQETIKIAKLKKRKLIRLLYKNGYRIRRIKKVTYKNELYHKSKSRKLTKEKVKTKNRRKSKKE